MKPVFRMKHHLDNSSTIYIQTKRHGAISLDDLIDKINKVLDEAEAQRSNDGKRTDIFI